MNQGHEHLEAFGSDISEKTISAQEQEHLIEKVKNETITSDEKDLLMGSLYKLVIKISRKFASRFPDRTFEDLVSDGMLNLWLRMPKFDSERSCPSTFTHLVVESAFCKELKKLNRRSIKKTITVGYGEDAEEQEINVPMMSLENFRNSEDEEYIPDAIGIEDEQKAEKDVVMAFDEMVLKMYKNVCQSIQEFKILNHLLNIRILPVFKRGRRIMSLENIADKFGTNRSHVERIANRVKPYFEEHDFISILSFSELKMPSVEDVFEEDVLNEYFQNNENDDIWDLVNGRI